MLFRSVLRIIDHIPTGNKKWDNLIPDPSQSLAPYRIFNIGNSTPIKLMDFIRAIENAIGKVAEKNYLPMQPGDVYQTNADTTELQSAVGFKPNTPLTDGVKRTMDWYKNFYKL